MTLVEESSDLEAWLRDKCSSYQFLGAGVFQRESEGARWPVHAAGPVELEQLLAGRGHLLPLPKEPAALANILEVSIVDFIVGRAEAFEGCEVKRGTERGYPDLEFSGPALGSGYHAVDVKAARRARNRTKTQSRITLYTGNTYFKWPSLHWPGTFRPFENYTTHLDVIMIYTFNPSTASRVDDLEIIVQEAWRIASRQRSSTTREYIGAVDNLEDLRQGRGEFATPESFYSYWRGFKFRSSEQVSRQLQRALDKRDAELRLMRIMQNDGET